MALLQWVILEPQGPGSLAAVRFSYPVRVRSLRIFPTGASPFKSRQDIVAQTEPSSLYLDVYFNAHPIATNGKSKPKTSNILVPTSIAYQGGQVEFIVSPVNNEFATRLMIVRGKFQKLSLAIYGDIVSEAISLPQHYAPKQLSHVIFSNLPPALDPASKENPTELAESLLTLLPAAERPTLTLVIRLMFCLKPSNEDWEEKEFPHLYSALDKGLENLSLEKALDMTCRPVSDTVDEEVLREFAERLGDSIVDYNDDQAYFLAKLLSQCAPQHPSLIRLILENFDLVQMYTEPNLDRPTLLYLLDAATSLDVSRQLNNEQTQHTIMRIRDNPTQDDGARRAAARLFNRIKGWEALEDSLLNTKAPFSTAALLIKEVGCEENSFGIWLENMLTNHEILDRLQGRLPVHGLLHPPVMWEGVQNVSHGEFIAFLRAAIGVAAVVAVYAWADSVPAEACRERTLAVLRVWQNVNGYREIVNHFMLMRQMAYRLEFMLLLDDDLPSQAGIDAEHILKSLAMQPMSMLRPDFVKVMQNLQVPLNYIADVEVMELKRAASMAKDGLQGAVRLLTRPPDDLDTVQSWYDVRIAVAVILDALQKYNDGEKELLEIVWDEGRSALSVYLIRHLMKCAATLRSRFDLAVPVHRAHSGPAALFQTCYDLLNLLSQFLSSYPPSSRDITALTKSVANIFVCTDAADMIYSQGSSVCIAAHLARQRCTEVLAALVAPASLDAQTCTISRNVLKALLSHAATPEGHDAAHHMTRIFWLFDHVLPSAYAVDWSMDPEAGRTSWIRQILPSILPQFRTFYALQETDNRLHLIRRFKDLDKGWIGVAEWLLLEEQQMLQKSIALGQASPVGSLDRRVAFWNISNSANILCALVESTAESSKWARTTLLKDENARLLQSNLRDLLSLDAVFERIGTLAIKLTSHIAGTDRQLRTSIVSILLRAIRCGRFQAFTPLRGVLSGTDEPLFDEIAARDFGAALERVVEAVKSGESLPSDLAGSIFKVLEKITPMNKSSGAFVFRGLTQESLTELTRWLTEAIPVAQKTQLEAMGLRWSVVGEPSPQPDFISSSFALELSLENWESLLVPSIPVPSTPKRRSPVNSAEMLGMITVSPPNALLRSPEVKGLTKTYSNNDFRELRQQSSARQNTSRMPSRHVDDFEQGSSSIAPLNLGVPSSSPPISYPAILPHRPLPLDPSLPMNPMYYQQ